MVSAPLLLVVHLVLQQQCPQCTGTCNYASPLLFTKTDCYCCSGGSSRELILVSMASGKIVYSWHSGEE